MRPCILLACIIAACFCLPAVGEESPGGHGTQGGSESSVTLPGPTASAPARPAPASGPEPASVPGSASDGDSASDGAPVSDPASASDPVPSSASAPAPAPASDAPKTEWKPLRPRALSTAREADPPSYVRPLSEKLGNAEDWSWLDFGLEHRTRFEIRDDFYRVDLESDEYFLMRSRGYVGIRKILDPLRFGFEFMDSRTFDNEFPETVSDINEADILQAFGELYLPDAAGRGQPLSLRAGRMSFDAVDRRLFARNGFRNTTNAFDGFRLRLGDLGTAWELDSFIVQPVERFVRQRDHGDDERWLYGFTGYWRGWSPHVVLEPYYFILDEDRKGRDSTDREIHTLGVRLFGLIGQTGLDYDINSAWQFGNRENGDHRAYAWHAELGYTFDHAWKPRVAALFNYASGDHDPGDDLDERFDSLFGASNTLYGFSDYFPWQNLMNPAVCISVRPLEELRFDAFYRAYWLASKKDAFVRAGLIDRGGDSGRFIGQELDVRMSWELTSWTDLGIGYAYFMPGTFVRHTEPSADDSDFFYVQLTIAF